MQICSLCKKKKEVAAVSHVHSTGKKTYVCDGCYFVIASFAEMAQLEE